MNRFVSIGLLMAQFVLVTTALADCVVPKAPGEIPDGSSASIDQMNVAKAALEKYEKAVKEYLSCVDAENKVQIAALGNNVGGIRQVKLLASKRTSIIEEELQKNMDLYNEQLRTWKLTNRQ